MQRHRRPSAGRGSGSEAGRSLGPEEARRRPGGWLARGSGRVQSGVVSSSHRTLAPSSPCRSRPACALLFASSSWLRFPVKKNRAGGPCAAGILEKQRRPNRVSLLVVIATKKIPLRPCKGHVGAHFQSRGPNMPLLRWAAPTHNHCGAWLPQFPHHLASQLLLLTSWRCPG